MFALQWALFSTDFSGNFQTPIQWAQAASLWGKGQSLGLEEFHFEPMASWDAFLKTRSDYEGETNNEYFQEKFFVLVSKHESFICGAEPNQKRLKKRMFELSDFKKIVFGQFWDCVHKIAHTSAHIVSLSSISTLPKCSGILRSQFGLNFRKSESQVSKGVVRC